MKFLTVTFLVLLLIFFTYEKILFFYSNFFTVNNYTKGADLILKLGGEVKNRGLLAIELYKEGYAKKILITDVKNHNKEYKDIFPSELDLTKKFMDFHNVKYELLKSNKGGATSTFDEAYDLLSYLAKDNKIKKVILVTSFYHSKRALRAFEKIFKINKVNIDFEVASAYDKSFNEHNWYKSELGIRTYIIESIKYIYYIFNNENFKYIKEN